MGRMPADRLNLQPAGASKVSHPAAPDTALDETVRAVLEVLTGAPLSEAAARIRMEPAELAAAAETYRHAGRRALEQQAAASDWWQLYLHFTDWHSAERTAAEHLAPLLCRAESDGSVTAWWFIRKHPCWRLRLRTQPGSSVRGSLNAALDELTAAEHIRRWWTGIYEPETAAFGGTAGMALAHTMFHADSRAILDLSAHSGSALGRRELSVLLLSTLLRAARLEWYEQGDVWHLVAEERPLPADAPPDRVRGMAEDLRQLLLADTAPDGPLLGRGGPAAFAAEWAAAFRRTGQALGEAARTGSLDRGLRRVLAYHMIFHWNRLGLPARTQSVLARAARTAVLALPASPGAQGQA